MRLSEADIDRLLATAPVARLATVGADLTPHVVPIVYAIAHADIWSPVDGKPKRSADLQRLRNVGVHPAASLLVDHYDDDWRTLWWVRVDATATVVGARDLSADAFAAVVTALEEKYPQYHDLPLFSGPPTLLRLRPTRRTGWSGADDPVTPRP